MASSGGNSLAAGHISGFPIGPNDIASPIGERQPGLDESALTGAAVSLFKDQIIQIGAGIITAVHGFTFLQKRYLTVYAFRSKKSDLFS